MGKWADLILTGEAEDKAVLDRWDRTIAEENAKRGWAMQPKQFNEPLPPKEEWAITKKRAANKYSDELLNPSPVPQASAPAAKPEGWGEWIYNSVKGRQDPKEANTGTVYDQFTEQLKSPTATGAMLGANDAGMADIIRKNLGQNFIRQEQDANGYPIIVSRGPDGQEQRGYVNKPGLDAQDMWRTLYGTAPYLLTGGAAGAAVKGAGIGVNALAQGAAAGVTKLGTDVAAIGAGSDQAPNLADSAVMAGFGAAGPVVGAAAGSLWRRFVTVPGLVDKVTGTLTPKGAEAARKAGLDPLEVTQDFAKSFAENMAKTGDPAAAAVKAGAERYGIPATKGQITKDPYLLTQEEGYRRRLAGQAAQDTMRGFDERQAEAVKEAAFGPSGFSPAWRPNVSQKIAPDRMPGRFADDRMSSTLGTSIQDAAVGAREAAKKAEGEAWAGAKGLEATDESMAFLPDYLNKSLGGRQINDKVMPAASAMAKEVDRIIAGEAPEKAAGWVANNPSRNVDQMRRTLLGYYKAAGNPEDEAAAKAIYDGFNDWIGEAARANMLKGDPEAAMNLVKARGFTKEVRALFEPRDASGAVSPGGKRLAAVLDPAKSDSGEGVVNALFGSTGSLNANKGAVQALSNLKTVLQKYTPDQAPQAWGDVGLAYWSRLVTGKNGEMLGAQAISNNIKAAFQSNASVMKVLYTPQQLTEIRLFGRAVENIAYKPPNASGSGYTGASFIKDWFIKFLDTFGVSKAASAAVQYTGAGEAWSGAAARQAVNQTVRPVRPNAAPLTNALGLGYQQSQ